MSIIKIMSSTFQFPGNNEDKQSFEKNKKILEKKKKYSKIRFDSILYGYSYLIRYEDGILLSTVSETDYENLVIKKEDEYDRGDYLLFLFCFHPEYLVELLEITDEYVEIYYFIEKFKYILENIRVEEIQKLIQYFYKEYYYFLQKNNLLEKIKEKLEQLKIELIDIENDSNFDNLKYTQYKSDEDIILTEEEKILFSRMEKIKEILRTEPIISLDIELEHTSSKIVLTADLDIKPLLSKLLDHYIILSEYKKDFLINLLLKTLMDISDIKLLNNSVYTFDNTQNISQITVIGENETNVEKENLSLLSEAYNKYFKIYKDLGIIISREALTFENLSKRIFIDLRKLDMVKKQLPREENDNSILQNERISSEKISEIISSLEKLNKEIDAKQQALINIQDFNQFLFPITITNRKIYVGEKLKDKNNENNALQKTSCVKAPYLYVGDRLKLRKKNAIPLEFPK